MELINDFFVSYRVEVGPKLFYIKNCMIGRICFFPTKRNIFVKDYSIVFLFDDNNVDLCDKMGQFISYTGIEKDEFDKLCWSAWKEEISRSSQPIY